MKIYEKKGVYGDRAKYSDDRLNSMILFVEQLESQPKRVLDIGCGTGFFLSLLKEKFPKSRMVGIDISREAIRIGKKEYKNIEFIYGNAEKKLPFTNGYFDLVISGEHIEHLADVDTYLQEINRVTKEGGNLLVTTPNLASWMNRILLLFGKQPFYLEASLVKTLPIFSIGSYTFPETLQNPPAGHLRLFTLNMIKKLLSAYGYQTNSVAGKAIFSKPVLKQLDRFFSQFPELAFGYILMAKKLYSV